jgi:hypothetical protein
LIVIVYDDASLKKNALEPCHEKPFFFASFSLSSFFTFYFYFAILMKRVAEKFNNRKIFSNFS